MCVRIWRMGMNKWWICECLCDSCVCVCVAFSGTHLLSHPQTQTLTGEGKQPLLFPLYVQYSSSASCFYCKSHWGLGVCVCVGAWERERGVPPLCAQWGIQDLDKNHRHAHTQTHLQSHCLRRNTQTGWTIANHAVLTFMVPDHHLKKMHMGTIRCRTDKNWSSATLGSKQAKEYTPFLMMFMQPSFSKLTDHLSFLWTIPWKMFTFALFEWALRMLDSCCNKIVHTWSERMIKKETI